MNHDNNHLNWQSSLGVLKIGELEAILLKSGTYLKQMLRH